MNEAPTAPAPAETTPAPAEAPATTPAVPAPAPAPEAPAEPAAPAPEAPAAPAASAPAVSPEQDAVNKQLAAQQAVQKVVQAKEDAAAQEIAAVCRKHGVELIVSHAVKVRFIQQ